MSEEFIFAEDVGHYWKTSHTTPDTWMNKTKVLIEGIGGVIDSEMIGMINTARQACGENCLVTCAKPF